MNETWLYKIIFLSGPTTSKYSYMRYTYCTEVNKCDQALYITMHMNSSRLTVIALWRTLASRNWVITGQNDGLSPVRSQVIHGSRCDLTLTKPHWIFFNRNAAVLRFSFKHIHRDPWQRIFILFLPTTSTMVQLMAWYYLLYSNDLCKCLS